MADSENASLRPPHGTRGGMTVPPRGTEGLCVVPPHGTMRACFAPSPVPPHGHLIDLCHLYTLLPSMRVKGRTPAGLNSIKQDEAADAAKE